MDSNSGNNGIEGQQPQPPAGQPQYAPQYAPPGYGQQPYGQVPCGPQGAIVPIGESWALGVGPMAVAPHRRLRWGIAGAVVLCVVLITAGFAFVLSGGGGAKSLTASAAPRNAIGFLEVRTDLPGDQHAKLADFLSHFPGFMDRAQFDTALDELMNRLISAASPGLTYTASLKPWMEGEVSVAVMDVGGIDVSTGPSSAPTPEVVPITPSPSEPALEPTPSPSEPALEPTPSPSEPEVEPAPSSFGPEASTAARHGAVTAARYDAVTDYLAYAPPSTVAIVALKDRAAAEAWVSSEVARRGMKTTSLDYAGSTLYTTQMSGIEGAYAFTDKNLLLGTVGGVKAALDTKTRGSLADNATYQTAMKSVSGDSLARFYVDCQGLLARLSDVGNAAAGAYSTAVPVTSTGASAMDVPAWVAGSVRAESDRMVVNVAMPRTGTLTLGNHVSRLASVLPETTVAVVETHSIGKQIAYQIAALEAQLPGADGTLEDALAQIGGVDWLGDGVAVVTKDGSTFGGGLVVEATDATTAATKVASIANLATLGGATYGILSRQETYKGVDITVIGLPASLAGSLGVDLPGGGAAVEIAIAAKGNLIVAGYTDAFVKAVIDTTPSTALASQSDYSKAMDAVGASNEQSFYINVPALEDEIGRAFFASSPSRWTVGYKPYFDHLGSVAGATIDGSTVMVRLVVMAR
jgi:hypothetical protein